MSRTSSWANVVKHGGGTTVPSHAPSLDLPRDGVLALIMPPGSRADMPKIARAIQQQCKQPHLWQPFKQGDHIYMQSLVPQAETEEDRKTMLEKGLTIGNISVKVKAVWNSLGNKDILSGRIENLTATEYAVNHLEEIFRKLGDVLYFQPATWPGTDVKNGVIDWVLNITATGKAPKSHYPVDHGHYKDTATVVIQGRRRFCYFCRSAEHLRKDCSEAPECENCGETSHPYYKCPHPEMPQPRNFPKRPLLDVTDREPGQLMEGVAQAQSPLPAVNAGISTPIATAGTNSAASPQAQTAPADVSGDISPAHPVDDESTQVSTLLDSQTQGTQQQIADLAIVEDIQGFPSLTASPPGRQQPLPPAARYQQPPSDEDTDVAMKEAGSPSKRARKIPIAGAKQLEVLNHASRQSSRHAAKKSIS